jgi:hypothetical protein
MKISIDTETDTYEDSIAALRAAFGVAVEEYEDEEEWVDDEETEAEGDDDYLPGKWTQRKLRRFVREITDDSAVAVRFMAEHAPSVPIDDVLEFMGEHTGIKDFSGKHMGGRMSSVGFSQNGMPGVTSKIYDTDYKNRNYRMNKEIAEALIEALDYYSK